MSKQKRGIYMQKTIFDPAGPKIYYTRIGSANYQQDGSIELFFDALPARQTEEGVTIKTLVMDKKEEKRDLLTK